MAPGELASFRSLSSRRSSWSSRHNDQAFPTQSVVICQPSFSSDHCRAQVVDYREQDGQAEYYLHYIDFDKRLDEWMQEERLQAEEDVQMMEAPQHSIGLHSFASGESMDSQKWTTRRMKRKHDELFHHQPAVEELPPLDQHLEREHQEKTKVKNIEVVELGRHEIDTWYWSPYPPPYSGLRQLFISEVTLKYFRSRRGLVRHMARTQELHPPGTEIYRSPDPVLAPSDPAAAVPTLVVFEVDGSRSKLYCQNLCLLSKLFLDHKTLYYDVEPFLFYVLCEHDEHGYHIVGYFSKEKHSSEGYNLACILCLPPYQRKGYGKFLISFSYELSKREGKLGTPERPLSDLGQVSYRSHWCSVLLDLLRDSPTPNPTLADLSEATAFKVDDIKETLENLGLVKYWKGEHIISVTPRIIEEHAKGMSRPKRPPIRIDPRRLQWMPPTAPAKH